MLLINTDKNKSDGMREQLNEHKRKRLGHCLFVLVSGYVC